MVVPSGTFKLLNAVFTSHSNILFTFVDSGYNCHHPLIKGFLPGSKLKLDISIPANADGFIMNLEGKRTIAFHFNPRFDVQQVVRNTKRDGEWGLEERDGVFPFRPSYKYVVEFECIDTHIITTVSIERKKFIFKYKHRVLPRTITNFSFGGNVNIVGIRYAQASISLRFLCLWASDFFLKV